MQPTRRAHEIAYLALSIFSSAVAPSFTCALSTERGSTARSSASRKRPVPKEASLSEPIGGAVSPTLAFAHSMTSLSSSCLPPSPLVRFERKPVVGQGVVREVLGGGGGSS